MKTKLDIPKIIIFLLILFIGGREVQHYFIDKDRKESYEAVIRFNEGEKAQLMNSLDLKAQDNKLMKQNIMSQKIALEQFEKELEDYKSINSYMKTEVMSSIKSLEAKYNSKPKDEFEGITVKPGGYIHRDEVAKNFLRVPAPFEYKDEWFSINGTVNKESTMIDSLSMFNKFDAVIGYKKSEKSFSWLRKKEPVVELTSFSPYTEVTYINNVVVDEKKGKAKSVLLSKPAMLLYGVIGGAIILK